MRFAQSTWSSFSGKDDVRRRGRTCHELRRMAEAAPSGRHRFLFGAGSEFETGGHGFSRGFLSPAVIHRYSGVPYRSWPHVDGLRWGQSNYSCFLRSITGSQCYPSAREFRPVDNKTEMIDGTFTLSATEKHQIGRLSDPPRVPLREYGGTRRNAFGDAQRRMEGGDEGGSGSA